MNNHSPEMNTYTITLINFNGRRLCRRVRSWSQHDANRVAAKMAQDQNWVKGWAVAHFEVEPCAESEACAG